MLAALGRDRIGATIAPSRYAYVGAALLLPALALLITAVLRRGPPSDLAGPASARPRARRPAARPRAGRPTRRSRPFRPSAWRRWPGSHVVSLVVAATVANAVAGARFARSRTVYVRGLENEIVTTGALLQSPVQLARAIDPYPIWASGFAAGYLTPGARCAHMYGQGLLPRARTGRHDSAELLNDESWLDLTGKLRPMFRGRFLRAPRGAVGLTLQPARPPAAARAADFPAATRSMAPAGPGSLAMFARAVGALGPCVRILPHHPCGLG